MRKRLRERDYEKESCSTLEGFRSWQVGGSLYRGLVISVVGTG